MHTLRETIAAFVIFSTNAFNLSGSLQILILHQFFNLYSIGDHDISCCVICLVTFIEALLCIFRVRTQMELQGVKKVPDPKQNYIGLMTEG